MKLSPQTRAETHGSTSGFDEKACGDSNSCSEGSCSELQGQSSGGPAMEVQFSLESAKARIHSLEREHEELRKHVDALEQKLVQEMAACAALQTERDRLERDLRERERSEERAEKERRGLEAIARFLEQVNLDLFFQKKGIRGQWKRIGEVLVPREDDSPEGGDGCEAGWPAASEASERMSEVAEGDRESLKGWVRRVADGVPAVLAQPLQVSLLSRP